MNWLKIMIENDTDDKSYKLKISAVGDLMLGVGYIHSINEENNILNRLERDYTSIIEDVQTDLQNTDILFGNFESIIHKDFDGDIQSDPKFLATTEKSIDLLRYGDFDVLNLANNHILDYGKKHASKTEKNLKNNGFEIIGSPSSNKKRLSILTIKDIDIGFLGYNLCNQKNKTEPSNVVAEIKENKELVDILVVSLHWGWKNEHMHIPSQDQIKLGRKIIDNGADIILGHHSHVFQPIELYKGKVIAYSLGNFIFDQWRIENKIGGILEIFIDENLGITLKVIPTILENYTVKVHEDYLGKMNDFIIDEIEIMLDEKAYKKESRKKRREHRREFLSYYIRNFHKMSPKVHFEILKNFVY